MTRQATPKAIEAYREKLLTNPATFGQRLRQVREDLRSRSEVLFIDRDLTAADKAVDEETRQAEFERIDEQILRVGARIDDLDAQIEAHNKAHPDAELAAKLMPQGQPGTVLNRPGPATLTRQQRRAMERATSKSEAKRLKAQSAPEHAHQPQTTPVPDAPDSAEETPKAEGAE